MLLNLVNLLSGTVSVTVESGFPERVLNLCSAHDLPFWDMTWSSPTCFSFKLSRRHYLQLRRLVVCKECRLSALLSARMLIRLFCIFRFAVPFPKTNPLVVG